METFKASNGVELGLGENGHIRIGEIVTWLGEKTQEALRELFLHERDQELGRWRWPDNPNYVVYPKKASVVEPRPGFRVVNEATGRSRDVAAIDTPEFRDSASLTRFGAAARAYADAHPEPKPWHDAKDGQLWLIRFADFPETDVSALVKEGKFIYNDHCHDGVAATHDSTLVSARRIWPEVVSDGA